VDSDLVTWTTQPSNLTITNSAFGAVDLATGSILWETPSSGGSVSFALPTVDNDVVFSSLVDNGTDVRTLYDKTPGGLIPVDKTMGAILKDYELGSNMHGGVAGG
jgi:outer membrane protein assembly factor BamB